MHRSLAAHQRLLIVTYRRYLEAERAFDFAVAEMRQYFPTSQRPYRGTIGAPGSRVRRLHETRERALLRLQSAQEKLKAARRRANERRRPKRTVLMLAVCP